MSANKTLKLLNSITSTTSASHRRRRSSAAVTAAASTFAPMFQSNIPPNFFPHCQPQQFQQQQGHLLHQHPLNGGGVNATNGAAYQQFLPVFVTPTTPASSDLHTSYHGTNVTSPPPYYFHTPPISSIGGAGGAAIVGNGKNQQQQSQQQQQQQQQQLFHPGPQAGAHGVNHSLHHTRANTLHQDLLNKKHASRPSLSQFSVANSSHFQFAFESQPPSHDSVHHSPVHTTNNHINTTTPPPAAVTPTTYSKPSAHSRQSSLNQVETVAQPQHNNHHQQRQQQQQQAAQAVVGNSGFSFLCLNPEPIQPTAPQPVVQNQIKAPTQGFLPGGFFSLTPEDSYPPLCTSFAQPVNTPRENHVNSYFPIMPVNPVVQQIAPRAGYPTGYHRPTYQRLTKHAISLVDSRDSREFRWNRVLRYVHEISAPHGARFPPSEAWIQQQRQRVLLTPRQDSKGDAHSLWDGGSLGTNGVDDFIWDDDLQNGKRFTIPPKSHNGEDAPCEDDNMVFSLEPSKADFDLAFGYEVDDTNFCPPAKRTKSNESQKAARRGLHEYLAALKSFELSHVQDMKREAPLTMA